MKSFFQGLVLGAAVMYWYLNYSADFFARVQDWFERTASEYRDDRRHEEADKALEGFLLRRDLQPPASENDALG